MFRITRIFEGDVLFAICDENARPVHERLFEQWQDPEFLSAFFNEHIKDIQVGFFPFTDVNAAVQAALRERENLADKFIVIGLLSAKEQIKQLKKLFTPLTSTSTFDTKKKAKADVFKPILRFYAIGIDDRIIITGGAIKLTATMNDRAHLIAELETLNKLKSYLIEQGVVDGEGLIDLIAEL